ncbi:Oxygen-independent coproporphyrinogen-III oxidase 1 [Thalassovita gelatinovora]|uniref:Heme chaperone HemW n=1 Tax=Thalassovita gelatinovora TaxID=53501 RepID=A0A0P1FX75_THAGE|nr:radical SAM family heme chaperone HemW [Thalassovita gelatinovora]QIZ81059.1 coproporphyrinogen III oxidase [Thalassovita gelatinovora]CUH64974.1 Oxygen-independent coproporphyrinogen-III oxidase 1 [Thalassovita gelatinovora]SEP88561.1 oxygen-independent coproporphyrinogen-3 oxidase [Thalassovita gelatinovora]
MNEDWQQGGFGLYLHWPFCQAKCPYCDFNSHVAQNIDQSRWLKAYLSELDRYAEEIPNRVLNSVFFGGGTPSLMDPDLVARILERIRQIWPQANDLEVTLEANPGSVESGRFQAYAQAGVNRVSMGIQALNNHDLRRLGRIHTVEEARTAFDVARTHFDRVSFDLIYARQDQTLNNWRKELAEALSMAADHLSLYQLTIEQGTAFGDRYNRGLLRGLPEDDIAADMYELTQDLCGTAGLLAYEVSNHAKPGSESRHNLIYWRYGDYIGIGPGAHGRITLNGQRYATETELAPGKWLHAVESGIRAESRAPLAGLDQAGEYLMMGLRIADGINADRYTALAGQPLNAEKLRYLIDIDMIEITGQNVSVTDAGRMVLNAVIKELLVDN